MDVSMLDKKLWGLEIVNYIKDYYVENSMKRSLKCDALVIEFFYVDSVMCKFTIYFMFDNNGKLIDIAVNEIHDFNENHENDFYVELYKVIEQVKLFSGEELLHYLFNHSTIRFQLIPYRTKISV